MQIVEQFVMSRSGCPEACEDAIVVTDHFAVVVDGATSKTELRFETATTGRKAAELIIGTIATLDEKIDLLDVVRLLTNRVFAFYKENDLVERMQMNHHERITAAVALFSFDQREIWLIGDCQCLIDDQHFSNPIAVEGLMSSVRALYLELELAAGKSVEELRREDTGRTFIAPLLKKHTILQNASFSTSNAYSVINGFEVQLDLVKKIRLPETTSTVVLATDGYPILLPTLSASESALRHLLQQDPLCFRTFLSTKGQRIGEVSFDDRAYLRIDVS